MVLIYENREEMQRSMRKASIREVFVRQREGRIRVTAHVDARTLACFTTEAGKSTVQEEIDLWKKEHFEVLQGEVSTGLAP